MQQDTNPLSFQIVDMASQPMLGVKVKGKGQVMAHKEVPSTVLPKMKDPAENYLSKDAQHAVIPMPAHFNDAHRQSTNAAGGIAGLNVRRIINDPPAAAGHRITDEERPIGEAAQQQATITPSQPLFDVKRLIVRRFKDSTVLRIINEPTAAQATINPSQTLFVQRLIGRRSQETAENHPGKDVKHAVLTVPAPFNDGQWQSTNDAGEIAGLNVLRNIIERLLGEAAAAGHHQPLAAAFRRAASPRPPIQ